MAQQKAPRGVEKKRKSKKRKSRTEVSSSESSSDSEVEQKKSSKSLSTEPESADSTPEPTPAPAKKEKKKSKSIPTPTSNGDVSMRDASLSPSPAPVLAPISKSNIASAKEEEEYDAIYIRKITTELADDLDKVREAQDFKANSIPMLIHALKQGESLFSVEEKRRVIATSKA